jgi:UPF0716 protein FxsA
MPVLIGFILLPIVEIWLLIVIGGEIGPWATILWILGTAVAGGALLRSQGAQAMARMREALEAAPDGQPDSGALAGELLDALAIVVAGICLILPGFVTDAVGILLFLPPVRRLIGRGLWLRLRGSERVRVYASRGRSGRATIIEGEYRDVSDRPAPERQPADPGDPPRLR